MNQEKKEIAKEPEPESQPESQPEFQVESQLESQPESKAASSPDEGVEGETSSRGVYLFKQFCIVFLKGVLLFCFMMAILLIYVQIPTPVKFFCDTGNNLAEITYPNGLSELEPCVPCPEHGVCKNGTLQCKKGFTKVPISIPDLTKIHCDVTTDIGYWVDRFAKNTTNWCTELAPCLTCGDCSEMVKSLQVGEGSGLDIEGKLKHKLEKEFISSDSHKEHALFDDVWRDFLKRLNKDETFDIRHESDDDPLYHPPNTTTVRLRTPDVSFDCHLRGFVKDYKFHLLLVLLFGIAIYSAKYQWRTYQKQKREAKALCQKILKYLSDQTMDYNEKIGQLSGQKFEKPKFAIRHLQDHFWKGKNLKVWNMAIREVESDSRVQKSQETIGHVYRTVWSWHGPPLIR